MKKIPTLFERKFENHQLVGVTDKVTPGYEWVLQGEGTATVKIDGTCCMIKDGELYKRYDAKFGKIPPAGAIPCCDPDPVTGHWPHWVKCDRNEKSDRWIWQAYDATNYSVDMCLLKDGTYEAIGPHINGNPYHLIAHELVRHGDTVIHELDGERTFEKIRAWLMLCSEEGIVFWKDGEPQCKIKRRDFGFPWPIQQ